jgi:small subunit ribosomal protein S16
LGTKKEPFWRVVVTDQRMPRDGRFIEEIGYYDPKKKPSKVNIKKERAAYWLAVGAQPSTVVKSFFKRLGIKPAAK